MKKLILFALAIFSICISVSAQEIIKTKSTFSTPNKPVTFSNPSGIDNKIILDSLEVNNKYYDSSKLDLTIKPLHLIKNGEAYYKINFEEFSKAFNPNFIQSVDFIKKETDLKKFGAFAKNGVMIINVEKDKMNDVLNFSKTMKYELIK